MTMAEESGDIQKSGPTGSIEKTPMPAKKALRELLEALITAILVAFVLKAFIIQAFRIPSGSMIPTLLVGDQILVLKMAYGIHNPVNGLYLAHFHGPQRGDIVVFRYPFDETKDFIKRVIGLPGDHIQVKDKIVYVNGKPMTEPYTQYLHPDEKDVPRRDVMGDTVVPPGQYFVMGDNRDDSYDSRYWGFVKRDKILGRAFMIYWSWNDVGRDPRWSRLGHMIH